jgi:3'-phosphoadenosine 5'-phosphosulfate (PAPS) 3'-phosphatase
VTTVHSDDLGPVSGRGAGGGAAIADTVATDSLTVDRKSSRHDFVTSADHAAEAAVLQVIRAARADDAVLTEESGVHDGSPRPGGSSIRSTARPESFKPRGFGGLARRYHRVGFGGLAGQGRSSLHQTPGGRYHRLTCTTVDNRYA